MKALLIGALSAICILGCVKIAHAQSGCHLRELDLCAATLIVFTQSPSGAALSDNELDKQCSYLKEADTCLKNFTTRCSTPLQQELIGFVTEGSLKLLDQYCTRGSSLRTSYLKHSTCLRAATRSGGQKACIKDLQSAFEVITSVEWDKRIPAGCCTYHRAMGCIEKLIEETCGDEGVQFMRQLLRMALSRLPNIVCDDYKSESKTCKTLLPPSGSAPKGTRSNSVLSRLFSAYTGL